MITMTSRTQLATSMAHIWLVLWLVAFPLIHIHPEADHAHGSQTHEHGGLFHSVLSQDLACEYHHHSPHDFPAQKGTQDIPHCDHAQTHLLNHDEIGFSILSASYHDSLTTIDQPITFLPVVHKSSSIVSTLRSLQLSSERAPPIRLIHSHNPIRPPPTHSA
ncbi:hypothetical protein [Candidatus Nitrospira salsa]